MRQYKSTVTGTVLLSALLAAAAIASAAEHRQIVDGVAVYFGIMPAELVRGHSREDPESEMHGGVPAGENHLVVALFNARSGERLTRAKIRATITGPTGFRLENALEPMPIAGAASYGNYFKMTGSGPYRIRLGIRLPGREREIEAVFAWART